MKKLLPVMVLLTLLGAGCQSSQEPREPAQGVTLHFFLFKDEDPGRTAPILTINRFRYAMHLAGREYPSPSMTIVLEPGDAENFYRITLNHKGETLALYCGDQKLLEARLMEPIPTGEIRITGLDSGELEEIQRVMEGEKP